MALRVSDVAGDTFRLSGAKLFTDLWELLERFTSSDQAKLCILDWGCGCGRVSRHLLRAGIGSLYGCDIDSEAVAWCAENLEGNFRTITTAPRLPYDDESFDVVIAVSVFTHLARAEQRRWLFEIARTLRPGGLLLASVAGPAVISVGRSPRLRGAPPGSGLTRLVVIRRLARLSLAGIIDSDLDRHLDGVAPAGYYRMVYQTRRYTSRAWTDRLDMLDFVPRGLGGHQDLVVLRRKSISLS